MFGYDKEGIARRKMHDYVVEKVGHRHADDEPEEGIGLDQPHLAAFHQQADNRHFGGSDDDNVRVIPEEPGNAVDYGRRQDPPAKSEELQGQHGENAAEKEVDIEEDREVEIVTRKTGEYKDEVKMYSIFVGYDCNSR